MENARLSIWTYLVLVFAGGLATGVFADRVYTMRTFSASAVPHSPEEWKRKYMAELRERCQLTEEQVSQVTKILEETRKKAEALRAQAAPEWAALHAGHVRDVRKLMSPSQLAAFDQLTAEREARHKAHARD